MRNCLSSIVYKRKFKRYRRAGIIVCFFIKFRVNIKISDHFWHFIIIFTDKSTNKTKFSIVSF